MSASTRLSDETVRIYCQVTQADVVVVLDDSLIDVVNADQGLRAGGLIIVNSVLPARELGLEGDIDIITSDATGAAQAAGVIVGGRPVVSTAILGSVAKATGLITLDNVESAIADTLKAKAVQQNIEAARIAYECTESREHAR